MINLNVINRAIFDTLIQVAPADLRFAVVMWDSRHSAISSNEMDPTTVSAMLKSAAKTVETTDPEDFRISDEFVGSA